jgi:hypothetical protein
MKFLKKLQNLICKILYTVMIVLVIFISGCSSENEIFVSIDDEIVNSVELEEYIIAASDFKQSLILFEKELSKVDFSKMEVTHDANGREIMHFPSASVSIMIEEKIQNFNKKKQALLENYPQFSSFALDISQKYFQQCIQSSLNVCDKLLEFGINYSIPLLKGGTVETWYGEDWYFLTSFLSEWVNSSNYVELFIITHVDGTYSTWIDDSNTSNHASITYSTSNGKYYFTEGGNTSPIFSIAHTHRNSSSPSSEDLQTKANMPGISHNIYYQGAYYTY